MRSIMFVLLVMLSASGVAAQTETVVFEALTVSTTAVGLTATTTDPAGAPQNTRCQGRLETAQVRYRHDGTAPTSSVGVVLEIGDILDMRGHDVASTIQFIRTGSTDATLNVHCWRETP